MLYTTRKAISKSIIRYLLYAIPLYFNDNRMEVVRGNRVVELKQKFKLTRLEITSADNIARNYSLKL